MLSGVMMLKYLKEDEAANLMETAIGDVIRDGKPVAGRIHNTVHALAGGSKP